MAGVRLLVGGMARSGTTLVQRLLCEIDEVWVASETHFWRYAPTLATRFSFPLTRDEAAAALRWLSQQPSVDYLDLDARTVCADLPHSSTLWDVFAALVRALCPPAQRVLGEKTPDHLLWAAPLLAAVHDLEVLGVVRDPRAVYRSHMDVPWGLDDVEAFAAKWTRHSSNLRYLQSRFGDRVSVARLDDVAADPAGFQQQWGTRLLGSAIVRPLEKAEAELFNAEEWWKQEALQPVEPRPARWTVDLDRDTIVQLEELCGAEMAHWGYLAVETPEAEPSPDVTGDASLGAWADLPLVRQPASDDGGPGGPLLGRLRDAITGG